MMILIMAGGTGGHVFPALAVADALSAQGHTVTWMGAPNSFESNRVPAAGYPIELVSVTGLRGKGKLALLTAPLKLMRAVAQARSIFARVKPQVALGMGGFVAGPGGVAAWMGGTPLVIHEQNAAAGLTNRMLARIARTVLQAFPGTFSNGATVGNPVRQGFAEIAPPASRIGTGVRMRVLVVGGSQGAKALNQKVPAALALMPPELRPLVRHQAGRTLAVARLSYDEARLSEGIVVEDFISDIAAAYAEADLVICRSGASTVAELSAAGCASVLVPFPFAVDDHQTANARYLSDANAAVLIPEAELSAERLAAELQVLLSDKARLIAMAERARAKCWTNATAEISSAILAAAGPTLTNARSGS